MAEERFPEISKRIKMEIEKLLEKKKSRTTDVRDVRNLQQGYSNPRKFRD